MLHPHHSLLGISVALLLLSGCASAPTPYESNTSSSKESTITQVELPKSLPTSAIFIGNSFFYYNNGIHKYVGDMAKQSGFKFRSTLVTINGSGLDWHDVESYFRPNAIASHSISTDGKNKLTFHKYENEALFDVAIMLDNSQGTIHPELKKIFEKEVAKNSKIVQKHGAKPILFMPWAYEDEPWMTQVIEDEYRKVALEHNATLIPAGIAFARVTKERPDIALRIKDKRHPTMAGTYLGACTVYSTLFRRSAEGLKNNIDLDEQTARYLQQVAWKVVKEFYPEY